MGGSFFGYAIVYLIIFNQFSTQIASSSAIRTHPIRTNTEYIRRSCRVTIYPRLCYRSLSIYATKIKTSPKLIALTALNVTLKSTQSTSRMVKKISKIHGLMPRVARAMADCVEEIGDCVYELKRSIKEMRHIRNSSFELIMSDVQTWVSAALTDEDTCMDGFEGKATNGNAKTMVRRHIVKISHLTSNALALINRYASRRKPVSP